MTNIALLDNVRWLEARHQGRYGSPRMHAALRTEVTDAVAGAFNA
jgi:putative transposase